MTDTADLVKELDGLNAELRLPVGNATDEELRDLGMKILARFNDGWPTIKAELTRLATENATLQARVVELEKELARYHEVVKYADASETAHIMAYIGGDDDSEVAKLKASLAYTAAALGREISIGQEACAEKQAAEARAAAIREATIEECAQVAANVQPRYPHIGHQYVCGNNDGKHDSAEAIRALKTAGKE